MGGAEIKNLRPVHFKLSRIYLKPFISYLSRYNRPKKVKYAR